eukprot:3638922-Pyramimonas_sp.AAC.1
MLTKEGVAEPCTVSLFWSAVFGPSSVVAMCTSVTMCTPRGGPPPGGESKALQTLQADLARATAECQAAKNQ